MKERIAEIIKKENLTSLKFANSIGVQPSAISHILSGRNNPSMDVMQKILNNFSTINSDWLILGAGAMYREKNEASKTQPFEGKIAPSNPQMLSLFDNVAENKTEYGKENNLTGNGNLRSPQNQSPTIERQATVTKNPENMIQEASSKIFSPNKVIKKIIVYYSDSTFEEYNLSLIKE